MTNKQTSSRISSLSAKVLGGYEPTEAEIKSLAASALSQDEVKGDVPFGIPSNPMRGAVNKTSKDRDRLIHILVVHFDMFRDKAEEAADLFLHDKTLAPEPQPEVADLIERLNKCADAADGSSQGAKDMLRLAAHVLGRKGAVARPEVAAEQLDVVWNAVLSCPHSITGEEIVLGYSDKTPGKNASAQLYERLRAALATPPVVEEAVKAEREACALVAEQYAQVSSLHNYGPGGLSRDEQATIRTGRFIAEDIRARSATP
jgi:hypothetical protein